MAALQQLPLCEMMSSLSTLLFSSGYHGKSFLALESKSASGAFQGEVSSWLAHAAAREEASDPVKAPLSESKEADSDLLLSRSGGKGFGSRPLPPPPKTPTPSLSSQDKKSPISRRPAPSSAVGLQNPDSVVWEQDKFFILAFTALGAVIFVEGIAVAASGFLSDELDAFVVKYIYPAFTPSVGLFLIGAVLYGVFKLRQGVDDQAS